MAILRPLSTRINIPSQIRRAMATTPPKSPYHFLVILPDKSGALQRRLDARESHFANLKSQNGQAEYKVGGALLKDIPKDDNVSSLDFFGSTLILKAESKEKVVEILKQDPYTKADVWDWDNVQIYPFRPGWEFTGSPS